MPTDNLIERLGSEVRAVPRGLAARRLILGAGAGVVVAAVLMPLWIGVRPDLAQAVGTAAFWIKLAYTLGIAAATFWLLERLARPGARTLNQVIVGLAPPVAVLVLAAAELAGAEAAERPHLIMGASSHLCPWRIVALALPVLIGALWALRGLAPTRPTLTGAVAGLCAGGAGAFVYAFHCDERAMPFLALWYSGGIVISGVIGAVAGRRLLRW